MKTEWFEDNDCYNEKDTISYQEKCLKNTVEKITHAFSY
jgi:hypothetical protein